MLTVSAGPPWALSKRCDGDAKSIMAPMAGHQSRGFTCRSEGMRETEAREGACEAWACVKEVTNAKRSGRLGERSQLPTP